MKHIRQTEFANALADRVLGKSQGDAKVLVDAENSRTGAGKTSAAVALARYFAKAFGYELKKEDLTLSGAEYLKRYKAHPGKKQPSVLVLDELVGAGAGDSRRAMSTQNVDLSRAWQLSRVKRVITFATLADFNDADRRLKKLADFRVMCLEKPFGAYKAYKLNSFNFGQRTGIRFKRLDEGCRTFYPDMGGEQPDPLYEHLADKKDQLLDSEHYDADELVDDEEDDEEAVPTNAKLSEKDKAAIQRLADTGVLKKNIAEAYDVTPQRISQLT